MAAEVLFLSSPFEPSLSVLFVLEVTLVPSLVPGLIPIMVVMDCCIVMMSPRSSLWDASIRACISVNRPSNAVSISPICLSWVAFILSICPLSRMFMSVNFWLKSTGVGAGVAAVS